MYSRCHNYTCGAHPICQNQWCQWALSAATAGAGSGDAAENTATVTCWRRMAHGPKVVSEMALLRIIQLPKSNKNAEADRSLFAVRHLAPLFIVVRFPPRFSLWGRGKHTLSCWRSILFTFCLIFGPRALHFGPRPPPNV